MSNARRRKARFAVIARFTGGRPAPGWLEVLPDGVVRVRQKGRRAVYLSTLDALASRVVWQDAQAKALERARQAKARKDEQRRQRAELRVMRGGRS